MTESFSGSDAARELDRLIARVRRRWRARRALNGLAVAAALGLIALVATCFALDLTRFDESVVLAGRVLLAAALVGLLWLAVLPPILRRAPASRVALYLEEREPQLGAAVLSAVELPDAARSQGMHARLLGRAVQAARAVDGGRRVDRRGLRRAWAFALAAAAAVALVCAFPPDFVRNGVAFLTAPLRTEPPAAPYVVHVEPGDTAVARGADLPVSVDLEGFTADSAELFTRPPGATAWIRRPMQRAGGDAGPGARFEAELYTLDDGIEYRVVAGGVSSETFAVDVVPRPEVSRIDLRYEYPAHTGLPPAEVRDGGDIEALAGTRVTVVVETTEPASAGALVVGDAQPLVLEPQAGGRLGVSFELERDGRYHVALAPVGAERLGPAGAGMSPASPEYLIRALEDEPPAVRVEMPGRDVKVTSIEEPRIQVAANDDFGLGGVALVISVNGGPEQTIPLDASPEAGPAQASGPRASARKTVDAGHTIYLEDLGLSPGDLVSYYARAVDRIPRAEEAGSGAPDAGGAGAAGSSEEVREAVTDLYFMEVRPFARNYREAQGGGGQSGQQQDEGSLSNRQREVVVAIFKLVQRAAASGGREADATFATDLGTVSSAESRILVRVEAIIRRLGEREQVREDEAYRIVAAELPLARDALAETVDALEKEDVASALPHAQTAMRHLQRADAASRDVQVSMAGQSGGGGQSEASDELTRLLRLELDKLRNAYEEVQRAAPHAEGQMTDELLEKLRELAQRQQKELERARLRERNRRQGGSASSGGGQPGTREAQEALADEAEALARRLERLTRNQPDPALSESLERLRQAALSMREAARAGQQPDGQRGQRQAGEQSQGRQQGSQPGSQQGSQQGSQSGGQATAGAGQSGQPGQSDQSGGEGGGGRSGARQAQGERQPGGGAPDGGPQDADALELTRLATQRIREARDALVRAQAAAEQRGLRSARERAADLAEQQRGVRAQIGALPEDYFERERALTAIGESKRLMESQARALENDIGRLSEGARESASPAAEAIERAQESARAADLPGRIAQSRERLRRDTDPETGAGAQAREGRIARAIAEIERRLARAATGAEDGERAAVGSTLDRMGDLIRDLESMRERLAREAESGAVRDRRAIARLDGDESARSSEIVDDATRAARGPGSDEAEAAASRGAAPDAAPGSEPGERGQENAGEGQAQSEAGGDSPGGGGPGDRGATRLGGSGSDRFVRQSGQAGRYADGVGVEAKGAVDWRGMRNEAAARVGDGERLRQSLAAEGVDAGDVEALLAELAAIEGALVSGAGADRLVALSDEALERLRSLDFDLREKLEEGERKRRYAATAPDGLPPELRALVERYYRSLAQ